ncbi:MAG: hypothetical protein HY381_02735, partial [Candidatus Chisholmbacteria bacterium]|nr:hypothetical protein [Candidatus Chisholmbacteria bacterium]
MSHERDLPNGLPPTPPESSSSPEAPQDISIEIGTSTYRISPEAQQYLGSQTITGEYEKDRSILIVHEPHYSTDAHFNLYKFLEAFFKDNPTLVSKTIFLAEGVPANQPVSVKILIKTEPHPSDQLIWETLNTFLITGYMAYEWKYQHGIPIIGTENPILYRLSARTSIIPDETTQLVHRLSIVARNQTVAQTLTQQLATHKDPILFIGNGHLTESIEDKHIQAMQQHSEPVKILTPEETAQLRGFRNWRLHDYLHQERIGYHSITTAGWNLGLDSSKNANKYRRLFIAQQTNDYQGYIDSLLFERTQHVVTNPSPEAAAQFVKAYLAQGPGNPDATSAHEKGLSLSARGKFAEAAAWYSAASAAAPNFPGYKVDLQEALFQEFASRVINIVRDPGKKFSIKPLTPADLPIFGPGIEADHYHKTSQFRQKFSGTPGVEEVTRSAVDPYTKWEARYGAAFQIKTAEVLGPERVRALEERHKLPDGGINRIDIATKTNVAIECKNFRGWVRPRMVPDWIDQAVRRLEPDTQGHVYSAIVIVIPENQNTQDTQQKIDQHVKLKFPELAGKIKVCRLAELQNTLSK